MDCHYCWNQPKKFGQYDFYLDGKIKADEFVYRKKNEETGKIESFSLTDEIDAINERLKTHFTFETTYKTYSDLETAFNNGELKETVIYVVENENSSDNPDSKDKYNEYMIVFIENEDGSITKKLELIGSGSYAKHTTDLYQVTGYTNFNTFDEQKQDGKDINSRINKEIVERKKAINDEELRALEAEKTIDEKIDEEIQRAISKETLIDKELEKRVPYTLHKSVDVVGIVKDIVKLDVPESSNEAMYCPQGLIMGGTAAAAGLVTRGICGASTPADDGSCTKENLYINYDGKTNYSPYRQLIIQADGSGEHYGNNLYQYAAARGDAVKGYVDEKIDSSKSDLQNQIDNRVVINDPISISKTDGDVTTTTTIDDKSISTTILTGTLDAESMKNSLTAEAIQQIVPIAWSKWTTAPKATKESSVALGERAWAQGNGTIAIGANTGSYAPYSTVVGSYTAIEGSYTTAIGSYTYDGTKYIRTTSQAPQTVVVGNGAQILNGTDANGETVQSSNSIAIGTGAVCNNLDSVVIGANAKNNNSTTSGNKTGIAIGAGASVMGGGRNVALGTNSSAAGDDTAVGHAAKLLGGNSVGIGHNTQNNSAPQTVVIGSNATITNTTAADGTITKSENSTVIGYNAKASAPNAIVVGAESSTAANGSILIGNNIIREASSDNIDNVVLIGKGARSITTWSGRSVVVGAAATCAGSGATALGGDARAVSSAIAVGTGSNANSSSSMVLGYYGAAQASYSTAIGFKATVSDYGATVIRSIAEDGTYTQLYFSGANTPLANTYENGEAMMGYVVRDKAGNIMTDAEGNAMVGTQKLSVLFPNNRGENAFTPAMLGLDDEWTPKPMFRPSDLDMPIEEPTEPENVELPEPEPEEYKPLPVYPIVEPTLDE